MKRRTFLQTSSIVSLPLLLNGMKVSALPRSPFFTTTNDSDRVLVLIQLGGGNDGLNTLIPLDQYDNLANVRQNIIIPESTILNLDDTMGFHPAMTGMKSLYDDAKIGIVQSVGYPNQNRSHFRSTDIWTTASDADEYLTTGWLGRYFDSKFPGYPEEYPNDDCPDPFAITIGSLVSETCQGSGSNFSLALTDPTALGNLVVGEEGDIDLNTCYGYELNFLRQSVSQTNAYSESVGNAADSGANLAVYPDDNGLAQQLKIVAQLISGGLQTSVYVVNIDGFDTHADQVVEGDPLAGDHALLLQRLSDAVAVFQQDLQLLGLEERVIGMTFSEFGRRIRSNNSFGTDHGTAAPLFVFGSCVNPTVFGENPEIPEEVGTQDGVPMQYDFRSVYGSVLMDWFGVTEGEVQTLLTPEFQYIPLIQACNVTSTFNPNAFSEPIEIYNYPNPCRDWTTLVYQSTGGWARISLFDSRGSELKVIADQRFTAGEHQLRVEVRDLAAGNYYYRIMTKTNQKTKVMVKQ